MTQGIAATALLALLASPLSQAADLGDIVLHSRIGEPLRAEIRLQGGGEIDAACFSLVAPPGNDLPAITDARLKVVREGNQRRLQISSAQAVSEPLFLLAVRGHCGVDLQRDYALMPQAPDAVAARPSLPVSAPRASDWLASEGESLRGIAEILSPDDPVSQRRMLAALRRANPGLNASAPLPAGTPIAIPDLQNPPPAPAAQPAASKPAAKKPDARPAEKPPAKPKPKADPKPKAEAKAKPEPAAAAVAPPPPPRPASNGDRIVLGNATDDLPPTAKARENRPGDSGPTPDNVRDMEDRIRRMEDTLRSLHKEIEQTNKVLELANEALVVQQKLRAAQAEQAGLSAAAQASTPPEAPASGSREWLELVLAAVLGGGLVAALVVLISRRRQPAVDRRNGNGGDA